MKLIVDSYWDVTEYTWKHHHLHYPNIESWPTEIRDKYAHLYQNYDSDGYYWAQTIGDPVLIFCEDSQWRKFYTSCVGMGGHWGNLTAHSWDTRLSGPGSATPCDHTKEYALGRPPNWFGSKGPWWCECYCHNPVEQHNHNAQPVLAAGYGSMLEEK